MSFDENFDLKFFKNNVNATIGNQCSFSINEAGGGESVGCEIGEECVSGKCQKKTNAESYSCSAAGWVTNPIDCSLLSILQVMAWLVTIAGNIFEVIVSPNLFNKIFIENGLVLYNMWSFIRDFLWQ